MSRRRLVARGVAPVPRIREGSRLMRTHETMVDFINGRHAPGSVLDVFSQGFLGLNLLRNFDGDLEDDFIYSDDSDDYDDHFDSHKSSQRTLAPHPRIRQLTEEEADKHAKELIEEEERRKDRTERNKRKKLRKKEKKRLEKENAAKRVITEEEEKQSDSSESQEDNPEVENKEVKIDSDKSRKTQNEPEAARPEERRANKKENLLKIEKKEEVRNKNLDLNNSEASTGNPAPDEKSTQRPAKERKKDKNKSAEVQESMEEKLNIVVEPGVQKIEKKHEPFEEKTIDPAAEELARKSKELAGKGNCFAAAGQFEMAVKYFTSAIKYNPKEFRLFGNRSLCYERLQQYENALQDADLALCLEPHWIKGLFRKGKALCGLKKYYEASMVYREVLKLDNTSVEAMQELKRAQTLQLMETGFTWEQSSEALKTHDTVEEAIEALFSGNTNQSAGDASASREIPKQPLLQVQEEEAEWTVQRKNQPRSQQVKESEALGHTRSNSQSPTPISRSPVKPFLYSVWVGSIAPSITHSALREVFNRVGTVYSVKMLLEHQCAFINYTKKEDCDRAVQCIDGMVVEGSPLSVRHPDKSHTSLSTQKKECFFWRTSGCTSQDCSFKHIPENKGIDKERFKGRPGNFYV